MKKVIKGKLYDTDTAKLICQHTTEHTYKAVYQKKTGHYFIYYKINSDVIDFKPTITPVTVEQAAEIAKGIMPDDAYNLHFGKASVDDEIITVTLRMRKGVHQKLKQLAAENNCTASEFVTRLIGNYLEDNEE